MSNKGDTISAIESLISRRLKTALKTLSSVDIAGAFNTITYPHLTEGERRDILSRVSMLEKYGFKFYVVNVGHVNRSEIKCLLVGDFSKPLRVFLASADIYVDTIVLSVIDDDNVDGMDKAVINSLTIPILHHLSQHDLEIVLAEYEKMTVTWAMLGDNPNANTFDEMFTKEK